MASGKKYKTALGKVDREKRYSLADGFALLPQTKISEKFDESVDMAIRLGVDPKHADQMVRGAAVMPHGTGKSKRVLVIAKADKAKEALDAGADFAGSDEYIKKIAEENWFEFDTLVATPDMMVQVGKVTSKQVREIAEHKLPDLNTTNVENAMKTIAGTARSMGLEVVD